MSELSDTTLFQSRTTLLQIIEKAADHTPEDKQNLKNFVKKIHSFDGMLVVAGNAPDIQKMAIIIIYSF